MLNFKVSKQTRSEASQNNRSNKFSNVTKKSRNAIE